MPSATLKYTLTKLAAMMPGKRVSTVQGATPYAATRGTASAPEMTRKAPADARPEMIGSQIILRF